MSRRGSATLNADDTMLQDLNRPVSHPSTRSKMPDMPDTPAAMEQMQIEESRDVAQLGRVDGGWGAWTYLIAATGLETLVWGLPLSYGVFLDYYTPLFPNQESLLPQVGTISTGLMYLLLPPLALYLSKNPRKRQGTMWVGVVFLVAGLICAAFAQEVWQLILTQGVLYAVGGVFLYCPVTSYMFEWWQLRRGFASGILFAGTGAGGLIMPFIAAGLLERFGRRATLLSLAVAFAVLLSALVPFIRPRLPLPAKTAVQSPNINWSFLRGKAFWLLWIGVLSQGLGGFMPGIYLPAFASALHLPSQSGTISVALMNLARVPGQVLIGYASDRVGPRKMILALAGVSALSVYAGWGSATNTGGILAFAIAFGGFAGSYTALYSRFINIIADNDPHLPPILYALFSFSRGIGNIASGPLSSALLALPGGLHDAKGGYGVEGYGALIIWTGAALALSGIGAGYRGLKRD